MGPDDRTQHASGEINQTAGFQTILLMVAILAAAVIVAIHTIEVGPAPVYSQRPNPSPLGYTYSLALFAFPMAALLWWATKRGLLLHLRAVRLTIGLLLPLWSLLDIFLGNAFFRFPVASATLERLRVWGYVPGVGFERSIPIEEFLFGGCVVLILLYIWSSEEWYSRYSMDPGVFTRRAQTAPALLDIHRRALAWGAVVFALGVAYKKLGPHAHHEGFPGYFLILLGLVVLPTAALFRQVKGFVNGRAFLFTLLVVTLVSLLWEVTLALPYGWWNYRETQMLGIFVVPWSSIPIEACTLWVAAGWGEVFIYEAFKIYVHSGRTLRDVLFGPAPHGAPAR